MSSISRRELVYALMEEDGLTETQAANFATELFEVVDKNRQVPDNCTHGFQWPDYTVRTKADDIAQAKEMREGEARESTRPVTLAEFQAQNTMQGLTITGVIEELEALRAQVVVLQRQVANGPNAPYTN
jgi:hypothetical protein